MQAQAALAGPMLGLLHLSHGCHLAAEARGAPQGFPRSSHSHHVKVEQVLRQHMR